MSHSFPQTETEKAVEGHVNTAVEIVDLLLRAVHLLRAGLNAYFAEFGLNDVRYTVLRIVRAAAPAGCSQTELAERLSQSESNICTLVERMRNDGLLYRLRSKADRRKRVLMLTPQGRQALDQIDSGHERRMDGLLRRFDSGQRQSFSASLELLVEELSNGNAAGEVRARQRRLPGRSASPAVEPSQQRWSA